MVTVSFQSPLSKNGDNGRILFALQEGSRMKQLSALLAALLLLISFAGAQEFRASITGEVSDSSGSPIPKVKVVSTNIETNVSFEAVTNESGRYTIGFMLPGKYTVTVEQTGFKKFVRENVVL